MKVAKWGNSLAIRIPKDVQRALKLEEGDEIELRVGRDGALEVGRDDRRVRALAKIKAMRAPLPEGYKFDREEANAR
ncbi:MAG: AbrB/MazE/SpoVT family DNA-binding domain-containing protein [Sphingomicrobium sp.]